MTTEPTERYDAPLYLARFKARQDAAPTDEVAAGEDPTPTYVKAYRARQNGTAALAATETESAGPLWQRASLEVQQALTEDNRNKEISPPTEAQRTLRNDVYLIRHGETQGYSTDSGLTPQGAMQAYTYGHTLAKRAKSGETIVFRHADTNRARETAEQIHRGLTVGIASYEKDLKIVEPEPMDEFRNFQFAAPDGLKDVTAAFRQYYAQVEEIERTVSGDRPLWLVEMDRFWRTQQGGGDPIQHWLTIPMIHFEPPSMAVRRFWAGINRLSAEFPGARLAIATHSGCIRAFAVAALGYDPGEPYNTEHVRVKLYDRDNGRGDASVAYRNRVQDTKVPTITGLPAWSVVEDWDGSGIQ
ncbi:MAG: histidine phosphatase family protein [Acidimicrobiales bacterium]